MTHRDIVSRKFTGKLSGFDDKQERRYQQKHLKAYLKGHQLFQIGIDNAGFPVYNAVKQQYFRKTA